MNTITGAPTLGVAFWNHYDEFEEVERSVQYLHELGVTHIRTGISWADWCRRDGLGGANWHKWVFETLKDFTILPCVWLTPPSLSENGKTNGPPKRLRDYADFIWTVVQELGDHFQSIELWNEPNNELKWSRDCDPHWEKFAEMMYCAAYTAKMYGKQTVLGGMSPLQCGWMNSLRNNGAMECIDVVAAHGFPGQWNDTYAVWGGWPVAAAYLQKENPGKKIWITEAGASSGGCSAVNSEASQDAALDEIIVTCPVERVYFYTLLDLVHEELEWTVAGYHEPLERSLGLVAANGRRKQAFYHLRNHLWEQQVNYFR